MNYHLNSKRLRMMLLLLAMAGSSTTMLAQKETLTFETKNMTVRELLNYIENRSPYTFAYADADLPLDKRVKISGGTKSIGTVLKEALPSATINVQNRKILISQTQKEKKGNTPSKPADKASDKHKGWNLSGYVVDDKGEPLIGATVMQKGTNNGATTDTDGKFTIHVTSSNPDIIARYVGYDASTVKGHRGELLKIMLKSTSVNLDEVVVTALGITRDQKSLGYAVTKVGGDDLNNTVTGNWLNNLDGKVAGLSASGAGTGPTGSMRVILSGEHQGLRTANRSKLILIQK